MAVTHSFDYLCSEISERMRLAHGWASCARRARPTPSRQPRLGPTLQSTNPLACKQEDGKLLRMLAAVFGQTEESEELLDLAASSGMALHAELCRLAARLPPLPIKP